VRIARASARVNTQPVRLAPLSGASGEYRTPVVRDPFAVSLDDKVDVLMRADTAMAGVSGVTVRESSLEFVREERFFASSEGSRLAQTIIESGGSEFTLLPGLEEKATRVAKHLRPDEDDLGNLGGLEFHLR